MFYVFFPSKRKNVCTLSSSCASELISRFIASTIQLHMYIFSYFAAVHLSSPLRGVADRAPKNAQPHPKNMREHESSQRYRTNAQQHQNQQMRTQPKNSGRSCSDLPCALYPRRKLCNNFMAARRLEMQECRYEMFYIGTIHSLVLELHKTRAPTAVHA